MDRPEAEEPSDTDAPGNREPRRAWSRARTASSRSCSDVLAASACATVSGGPRRAAGARDAIGGAAAGNSTASTRRTVGPGGPSRESGRRHPVASAFQPFVPCTTVSTTGAGGPCCRGYSGGPRRDHLAPPIGHRRALTLLTAGRFDAIPGRLQRPKHKGFLHQSGAETAEVRVA